MPSIEPRATVLELLRRWVVDFFNRHDGASAATFAAPEYELRIGDFVFSGRDDQWVPAVQQQMDLFPGLTMTVHGVLVGDDRVAMTFTEHGASGGTGGRVACWSGVALFQSNGELLFDCVSQEDYHSRQRQLKSGVADPVRPPCASPWDTPALPANPQAEAVVRAWLQQSWPPAQPAVVCDDEHVAGVAPMVFEVTSAEVTELFSSGDGVAFAVRQTGLYRGGLPGVAASDRQAVLLANGLVQVVDGQVQSGLVVRDRAGLKRSLAA